jgi:hypothetical protein
LGIKVQRHTYRLGASRAVTLPPAWVNYYGDRANKVTIIGSSLLVIAPEGLEAEAEKLIMEAERVK